MKVGDRVTANTGGLGLPYRAEIEDIWNEKALLLPLEVPFTASAARTGNYKKRRRWVRLDRLEAVSRQCRSCGRMFVDGETCSRGGCPMGGDV